MSNTHGEWLDKIRGRNKKERKTVRLIDADALIKSTILNTGHVPYITKSDIADAPTVEERKKGKWIPHPNKELREWDVCTACGTGCKRREYGTNPDGTEYITEFSYLYCPNCGADMRQGGEEDETDRR